MRLEIVKVKDSLGLSVKDYTFKLNGVELDKLLGVEISMHTDEINIAKIIIAVDDLQVDADFVAILNAELKSSGKSKSNASLKSSDS